MHISPEGRKMRVGNFYTFNTECADSAAAWGYLGLAKSRFPDIMQHFGSRAVGLAASGGHYSMVKWIVENQRNPNVVNCKSSIKNKSAMDMAVTSGSVKMMQWLHDNNVGGCSTTAMDLAASLGNLKLVKWLHKNRTEGCTERAMDFAALRGELKVIKWLHENRKERCSEMALIWAIKYGRLPVVKWLWRKRNDSNMTWVIDGARKYGVDIAAKYGKLPIVMFLCKHDVGHTSKAMRYAAKKGHLDVVKWFYEEYDEMFDDTDILKKVCVKGHIHVAKWLWKTHIHLFEMNMTLIEEIMEECVLWEFSPSVRVLMYAWLIRKRDEIKEEISEFA